MRVCTSMHVMQLLTEHMDDVCDGTIVLEKFSVSIHYVFRCTCESSALEGVYTAIIAQTDLTDCKEIQPGVITTVLSP